MVEGQPVTPPPAVQLPVADLIGLRFSLLQLRLVGYGVLGSWLVELVNLLTSPGLLEIGTRLHYISQFLDLTPLLLAGIGLVAYQGGLRRSPIERRLLPFVFSLLPLVCAFHFFLAPVSVANAVTLIQKQRQIGNDQLQRIDRQLDRAAQVLNDGDSIESLLERLQQIPGLRVRVPADASVAEARRQVRSSLERERSALQTRIRRNLATSADAFWRRSLVNAALALGVGLLVWGIHSLALREMSQAVPYLDWFITASEAGRCEPSAELELLSGFLRSCLALSPVALLELVLRRRRREQEDDADGQSQLDALVRSAADPLSAPPAWPEPPRPAAPLRWGSPLALPLMPPPLPFDGEDLDAGDPAVADSSEFGDGLPPLTRAEWRRQQRDYQRATAHWAAMAQAMEEQQEAEAAAVAAPSDAGAPSDADAPNGSDPFNGDGAPDDAEADFDDPGQWSPAEQRRRARDLERSRQALRWHAESPSFNELYGGFEPGVEEPLPEWEQGQEPEGRPGFWARLFRRR